MFEEIQDQRLYVAVTARELPNELVPKLFKQLVYFGIEKYFTRVTYEKQAHRQNEYYLFLRLTNAKDDFLPPDVDKRLRNIFSQLHLRREIDRLLTYDEIRKMVSKEIEGQNIRHIRMPHLKRDDFSDPNLITEPDKPSPSADYGYNELLYWLSAMGRGSWDLFKRMCQALGFGANGDEASRILRRLRLMGHVETYANSKKWIVSPPCLVERVAISDEKTYFLAGQRSQSLINGLKSNLVQVEAIPQPKSPDQIIVRLADPKAMSLVVEDIQLRQSINLRVVNNAALKMAAALPNLEEWIASLEEVYGIEPSLYTIQRWEQNRFIELETLPRQSGFYQLERSEHTKYKSRSTLFYDAEQKRWLHGDWYGLRFLTLYQNDKVPFAFYDENSYSLAIDYHQRWPERYERALVLSSGTLPRYDDGWLVYEHVSPHSAYLLTDKLKIELKKD